MSTLVIALVALAGGVGAGLRYVVDALLMSRARTRFPLGILVVNASGSLALGALTGATAGAGEWPAVLGIGLLGGYTTFSTVAVESVLLAEARRTRDAWMNTVGTAAVCVAAAFAGLALGRLVALPAFGG